MPNRRGGARKNSGRKPMNQTWGKPGQRKDQPSLRNFFQSQNETSIDNTINTIPEIQHQEEEKVEPTEPPTVLPNYDVDPIDYEDDNARGKRTIGSINLTTQKNEIMQKKYYEKASDNIKKHGILWNHPPTMIVKVKSSLETCWLDFFRMSVFNWIPEVIIGDDWSFCPNCGEKLSKNGHTNPPLLVFGQNENYLLNSPQKYVCIDCRDNSKDRQNHEPKLAYNFTSTTSEILQQIGDRYPEIMDLFPCHITHQNAIDKKLMNLIIHNAVKGIGPIATRESLVAWHELEWQKRENLWANFALKKLNQPTINQRNIDRADIEKCPHYFSLELGGCVPGGSWMVQMFCSTVQKMCHYYDSECIKRAKTSKVIAIDASYKVPKWMMKWGSGRIYDALHSGTNEYNEIIMQRFSTSDNHEELSSNLKNLSELGVNPYLCFSDDPSRDESILKKTFSNLGDYIEDSDDESTDKDDLQELTSTKTIMYLHTYDNALTILSQFVEDVNDAIKQRTTDKVIISLDTGELLSFFTSYNLIILFLLLKANCLLFRYFK